MDLLHFRLDLTESLIKAEEQTRKRGRPSNEEEQQRSSTSKSATEVRPMHSVQWDNLGHYPCHTESKIRCKKPNCSGRSRWKCIKCEVHLCLEENKNCFIDFHKK